MKVWKEKEKEDGSWASRLTLTEIKAAELNIIANEDALVKIHIIAKKGRKNKIVNFAYVYKIKWLTVYSTMSTCILQMC